MFVMWGLKAYFFASILDGQRIYPLRECISKVVVCSKLVHSDFLSHFFLKRRTLPDSIQLLTPMVALASASMIIDLSNSVAISLATSE